LNNNNCKISLIIVISLFIYSILFSQEHDEVEHKHRISGLYGLVYVPEGHEEGNADDIGILIASYGLEYSYRLNHKWALGIAFNLEGGKYIIHDDVQRENAFLIVGFGAYEVMHNWELYFGGGIEIEKHHNYGVLKFGTLYKFPIGKGWDISPAFTFNHKSVYNSWEIALTVGKNL